MQIVLDGFRRSFQVKNLFAFAKTGVGRRKVKCEFGYPMTTTGGYTCWSRSHLLEAEEGGISNQEGIVEDKPFCRILCELIISSIA